LDAFRPGLDRGSSDFDVRHRLAVQFIWEIPRGRNLHTWERYAFQGWGIKWVFTYQTGQPFSIADFGTPDTTGEQRLPRLAGALRTGHSHLTPLAKQLSFSSYQSGLRPFHWALHCRCGAVRMRNLCQRPTRPLLYEHCVD